MRSHKYYDKAGTHKLLNYREKLGVNFGVNYRKTED